MNKNQKEEKSATNQNTNIPHYSQKYNVLYSKLKEKEITIIGTGGIGSWLAEILAKTGINLTLIDHDTIDLSNLERQNFEIKDINQPKVTVLKEKLKYYSKIKSFQEKITPKTINLITKYKKPNLVIDCTDNLDSKLLINDYCKKKGISLLHTSAIENKGFIYLVTKNKPCLQCIYKNKTSSKNTTEVGVTPSIVITISSIAANIAIDFVLGIDSDYYNILYINLDKNEIHRIKPKFNPKCECCKKNYIYLDKK